MLSAIQHGDDLTVNLLRSVEINLTFNSTSMSKYIKLMQASTKYATRMNQLKNRIFGDPVRKTDLSSMRVVRLFQEKPVYLREEIVDYYPRHMELYGLVQKLRYYGLFRDEHADFNEKMRELRVSRGKMRPEKGKGKRGQK